MTLSDKMGAGIYASPLTTAMNRWGIADPRDQARFLAQVKVESANFTRVVENLRYKPERLVAVFKTRNGLTPQMATILCGQGEMAVGNFVYGGAWGLKNLGNTEPNDGYEMRGGGLIMTTGRSNYRDTALRTGNAEIAKGAAVLSRPDVAADAAACFWYSKKLNGIEDIVVLTKKINGGSEGLDRRVAETNLAYSML